MAGEKHQANLAPAPYQEAMLCATIVGSPVQNCIGSFRTVPKLSYRVAACTNYTYYLTPCHHWFPRHLPRARRDQDQLPHSDNTARVQVTMPTYFRKNSPQPRRAIGHTTKRPYQQNRQENCCRPHWLQKIMESRLDTKPSKLQYRVLLRHIARCSILRSRQPRETLKWNPKMLWPTSQNLDTGYNVC